MNLVTKDSTTSVLHQPSDNGNCLKDVVIVRIYLLTLLGVYVFYFELLLITWELDKNISSRYVGQVQCKRHNFFVA